MMDHNYNVKNLQKFIDINKRKMNKDQISVYNIILDAYKSNKGDIYFLDAPGLQEAQVYVKST